MYGTVVGELTTKGFNKRKVDIMMRLLEVEFEAGIIFNFSLNFIYINIVVGELTSHGFEIRKRRLVEEAAASSSQSATESAEIGETCSAANTSQKLKDAADSRLSETINKLFGKCTQPNTSKVK